MIWTIHILALLVDVWGLFVYFTNPMFVPTWSAPFKFLTVWNMVIQPLYFAFVLVVDLWLHRFTHLKKVSSVFFYGVVFPLGLFVAVAFWGLYFVDRELVFPSHLDTIYPPYLNQQQHTAIVAFIVLELLLARRPRHSVRLERVVLACVVVLYLATITLTWLHGDHWPYPVLNVLDWPGRIAFFAASIAVVLAFHQAGSALSERVLQRKLHAGGSALRKPVAAPAVAAGTAVTAGTPSKLE